MRFYHLALFPFVVGCGINLYDSLVTKEGDRYHLSEAEAALDEGNFTKAEEHLGKVEGTSEERTLVEVSILLGRAELGLWKLLVDIVDSSGSSSSSGGVDQVFDQLSESVFGTGSDRLTRTAALRQSSVLLSEFAGQNKSFQNLKCFLSGILVLSYRHRCHDSRRKRQRCSNGPRRSRRISIQQLQRNGSVC